MYVLYIIFAILIFGFLIAIHELGHFVTAKLTGVQVNEFAIGMGPVLWKKQKGETLYSLRLFPVGGFCAMEGEDEDSDNPRAFGVQKGWKKVLILAAGAFMNFVAGLVLLLIVVSQSNYVRTTTISGIMDGFPNQPGQVLQTGDRVLRVDGHAIYLQEDISLFLSRCGGDRVDLVVERDGERLELSGYPMSPVAQSDGSVRMMLGIELNDFREATLGVKLEQVWLEAVDNVRLVWYSLSELLRGALGLRDLSGPVGIISMVGRAGEQGAQAAVAQNLAAWYGALVNILSFASFIAINLAVMNLLPLPALDGGRIFFVFVNAVWMVITRKRIDPKYEGYVHGVGLVALLVLMVVIALSDVWKLIS